MTIDHIQPVRLKRNNLIVQAAGDFNKAQIRPAVKAARINKSASFWEWKLKILLRHACEMILQEIQNMIRRKSVAQQRRSNFLFIKRRRNQHIVVLVLSHQFLMGEHRLSVEAGFLLFFASIAKSINLHMFEIFRKSLQIFKSSGTCSVKYDLSTRLNNLSASF